MTHRLISFLLAVSMSAGLTGCVVPHSKQALYSEHTPVPSDKSEFITAEDSGLGIFGFLLLSEPDHYAVLLERARRRHRCARISHAQFDYYTDHWIVVSFPISRITMLCEPELSQPETAVTAEAKHAHEGASVTP